MWKTRDDRYCERYILRDRIEDRLVKNELMNFKRKTSIFISCGFLLWQDAENRRNQYKNFYRDRLFPLLTERYLTKYGGSFPLSGRSMLMVI